MAASAASAIQSNRSSIGIAYSTDQVPDAAIDLDSVAKPLFCGESGYGYVSSTSARATRRREIDADDRSFSRRHQSFREEIGHAAAETYFITRLSFKLLSYLGVGYRWITRFLGLAYHAMLLLPGFLQVAYYYYFSKQVHRSVIYGDQPRNRLDLHLPTNCGKKPVVVFVTGGAWIIGYKAWGSLLGKQLAERGIIIACLDYRNFPQGTIPDMVNDVFEGMHGAPDLFLWVISNTHPISLPAALALAAEPIASLLNTAFVGRLGSVELAAVRVSVIVFNLVSKLFNVPLLNVTTSFVAEEQAWFSEEGIGCSPLGQGRLLKTLKLILRYLRRIMDILD